jgi:hypothetical protein
MFFLTIETNISIHMEIEIDKETVYNTIGCKKNFDCMKNSVQACCKVENCVNKKVHFVACADNVNCSYKISFGGASICTCKVRKEIFNIYGI